MKTCNVCNKEKQLNEFHFRKDQNKYRLNCIECHRKKDRERNIKTGKNSFKLLKIKKLFENGLKNCPKCNNIKKLDEFANQKDKVSGKQSHCKNCVKENKDKDYINNYVNKRLKEDCVFNFKFKTRNLIRSSFKRNKNYYIKSLSTEKILGCSVDYFRNYIFLQFKKNMSFENYGQWHLDHIYPVSLAKDEEEVIRLNHYTNFQPLWAKDNLKKGNKIIDNTQLKLI
jgi:hypothetical protein